ncbi:GAF domain-containing protein [Methylobacterium sp. 17Sr1-1]|uniref:GAF domain-containing protein n=1 Tax=Methylobacterium sp. 17Sr1-1 TaxID=2202826 RepID=UPI000D6F113E|nr:GAF domain-containing protein [Methylobacterium sp. 17Sr1-1]AWN51073.1 hypothetical protein DK412_04560 [Methylobacterium sp. 17Sr1-1]
MRAAIDIAAAPDGPPTAVPTVLDPTRLAALDAYAILDTPAEDGFDDIVRLAARLCAAPVALVSLVAADRQWFKARVNFPSCETDLNRSVCQYALIEPDLLVIPDLTADPRTATNPLVTGEPRIRFYAGAPLRLPDGHVLGSLCVIDTVSRPAGLTTDQADDLRALGRQVSGLMEMRRTIRERDVLVAAQRTELRRQRHLDIVARASAALLETRDPSFVLQPILETGAASLGFDQCYIYDVGPNADYLALTHDVGVSEDMRAALRRADLDGPLCGIVVQTGQPLVLENVQESIAPRYDVARQAGIDAFAGYPIQSHGRTVGVISFCASDEAVFDAEALAFFGTMARFLSVVRERLDDEKAMHGSEERYRALLATAGSSIYRMSADWKRVLDLDGEVHLQSPEPDMDWLERYNEPADRPGIMAAVEDAIRRQGPFEHEHRVRRADGSIGWVLSRAVPILDQHGTLVEWFGSVTDITERREAQEALRESEAQARAAAVRRKALIDLGDHLRDAKTDREMSLKAAEIVGQTLGGNRAGYGELDPTVTFVTIRQDNASPGEVSVVGNHSFANYGDVGPEIARGEPVIVYDVAADPRTVTKVDTFAAINLKAMLNVPVQERGRTVGLIFVHSPVERAWTQEEVAFARNVADRVQVGIARLRAEEQQVILNGELSHRLKNTLAMVQGIASQTLRSVPDQAPVQAFTERLIALSQAHDVLMQDSWAEAPIRSVVDKVLALQTSLDRFRIEGPSLALSPQATLSLSLLLHELTTNAVKYGALSVEGGIVHVAWRIEEGVDRSVVLTWKERGGPPATAPTRRGFGARLIQVGLVGTRDTRLSYSATGLDAEFRAPISQVVAS